MAKIYSVICLVLAIILFFMFLLYTGFYLYRKKHDDPELPSFLVYVQAFLVPGIISLIMWIGFSEGGASV